MDPGSRLSRTTRNYTSPIQHDVIYASKVFALHQICMAFYSLLHNGQRLLTGKHSTMKDAISDALSQLRGCNSWHRFDWHAAYQGLSGPAGIQTIAVLRREGESCLLPKEGYTSAEDLSEAFTAANSIPVVASDTNCHMENAIEGISFGCGSILVEKPLAPVLADALRLQAAISKTNTKVFLACNLLFDSGPNLSRAFARDRRIHHVRTLQKQGSDL